MSLSSLTDLNLAILPSSEATKRRVVVEKNPISGSWMLLELLKYGLQLIIYRGFQSLSIYI